jgi:hypothetical protein
MTNFTISISIDELLTKEELWPDGNAPENPTVDDVIRLIEKSGGVGGIIKDWNLLQFAEGSVRSCCEIKYFT